jgi:hypothetical protein
MERKGLQGEQNDDETLSDRAGLGSGFAAKPSLFLYLTCPS